MVLPGEVEKIPEEDEIRLLKSGRVRVSLAGDRTFVMARPKIGQLKFLLETFEEIRGEFYRLVGDDVQLVEGKTARQATFEIGPRWWTHVVQELGPVDPETGKGPTYDSVDTPAWTRRGDELLNQLQMHWMTVPLVSDVEEPEPAAPTPTIPTLPVPRPEPQILRQVGT